MSRRYALFSLIFLIFLIFISYFSPIIANNKPIFIIVENEVYMPAVKELFPFNILLKKDEFYLKIQSDYKLIERLKEEKRIKFLLMPLSPHSPYETDLDKINSPPNFKNKNFFGCDENGRDVFARVIHGARNSLLVAVSSILIAGLIGIIIGGIGGYIGGLVDEIFTLKAIEVMASFPSLFLIITIAAIVNPKYLGIFTIVLIIGLTSWVSIARLIRGEFMKLRKINFVLNAKICGGNFFYVIRKHLLPNSLGPLIATLTFGIGGAIFAESGLSFLGIGIQPPEPSWGNILSLIQKSWDTWWVGLFPGLMIFLTILSFNFLGEFLNEEFETKRGAE